MLIKFLNWLMGTPEDTSHKPEPRNPLRAAMTFSTDSNLTGERRIEEVRERALKSNIQRDIRKDIYIPAGTAMDSKSISSMAPGATSAFDTISESQLNWFGSQGFIGYQLCAILAQHWLISKACRLPGEDALRNGYEITIEGGRDEKNVEIIKRIRSYDEKYKLNANLEQFSKFNRVFGIRVAMFDMDVDSPADYYSKPFNLDGVIPHSYRGIVQVDPYWIIPQLDEKGASDPASLSFYQPTWWQINGLKVHHSHLIIIRYDEVADILKPTYYYGGIPLTQQIYERVYAAERTANEAPLLTLTKRLNVYKTDLEAAIANQGEFENKLQEQVALRDNYGIKVIGLEEDIMQFDVALADLDVTIMTQYQLCSSIANMPAQKLFGTTPKGFNSTGEYEESSYHELLETIQTHNFDPLLKRHHDILIRSQICPEFGNDPFSVTVVWEPLDSETSKERAEINKLNADTTSLLINAGVIDGEDARNQLIADEDSGYGSLDPNKEITSLEELDYYHDDLQTNEF